MSDPSSRFHASTHRHAIGASRLLPPTRDLITVGSRRWFLQTGLAGFAELSLADTLLAKKPETREKRSVILFWLSGGPSQIDTWDPKPDAPIEIRGPYRTIQTSVPGLRFCEHLPLQAKLAHKLNVIRSVDCSTSTHTPITLQAGNALAKHPDGGGYPSMGSVAAKFRGANVPGMPAFIGLAPSWVADVYGAGHMGSAYEPVNGSELPGRLSMPQGIQLSQLQDRTRLRSEFDRLDRELDTTQAMASADRYAQMALDMVVSPTVRKAFDLSQESDKMRDAYGRESVGEKALLARRLVEAGSTFVLVSGKWGYFDHHGDTVLPWYGIQKGLTPILPTIDRALTTLIEDLEVRGLLDSTLILMMGEFGRAPVMNSVRGRDHWLHVMSMVSAGGSGNHGQAIGSTDAKGGEVKSRKVIPSDLAATVFRHLDIPLDASWMNPQGRPIPIVTEGGQPISEMC